MGVVYKGRDPGIGRTVALKTLTSGLSEDPNLLKRFYTEAQSAGNLQHPNIVTIYELGQEGGTPFIAMQFLNGESLDKIIDRRPKLPLSQKIGFIVYVCRALEYAHKQIPPVVHRDIKPGNVMVTTEGNVVVVDFGIARLGEGTRSQSAGMLIGTLGYMSPQLFRNSAADARSDIWAAGVMFYELLAYRRPFEGDNAAALMSSIILEKPRSLAAAAPGTPADVQAVVDRMLAKEVDARYQTMEEVLLELEPVWRRLQQSDVEELLEESQHLFESGEFENAKAKVSQILRIDASNTLGKSLHEKIVAQIKLKELVPKLREQVEKAGFHFAKGDLDAAKAQVEAALRLDSTFLPARELRAQLEAAIERAHQVEELLHASKKRMAEGALTEAELQLDKVLEMDPGNAAARELSNQLREQRLRRQRRKRRDESLHRARTLWTNLQYEECIKLLLETQKEFPNDTEISNFLERARQDQADQERQALHSQASNQINTQQFGDALAVLNRLLEQFPGDSRAKNLRADVLQRIEQQKREQRLAAEKAKLRSWVKEEKYPQVISLAGQLLREFPDDFDLAELLKFARTEQARLDQKLRLEQFSKQIQLALKESRFSEAATAAEKALREFPKNADFQMHLDRAKKEQAEKDRSRLLEQQLRKVNDLIGREKLTDALDVARQTFRDFGHDSRIDNTLHKLEKEFEFREKRTQQQEETFQRARAQVDAGKITDATSILNVALDTQLFSRDDPRITQLFNEIDLKKEPPPTAVAPAGTVVAPPSATSFGFGAPISSTPTGLGDAGKDYVYQKGAPLPALPSVENKALAAAASASANASAAPTPQTVFPPVVPTVTPGEQKPQRKPGKQPRQKEGIPTTTSIGRFDEAVPGLDGTVTDRPPLELRAAQRAPVVDPADIFEPELEELPAPRPQPISRPLWKNPLVVGSIVIALVVAISTVAYFSRPNKG